MFGLQEPERSSILSRFCKIFTNKYSTIGARTKSSVDKAGEGGTGHKETDEEQIRLQNTSQHEQYQIAVSNICSNLDTISIVKEMNKLKVLCGFLLMNRHVEVAPYVDLCL